VGRARVLAALLGLVVCAGLGATGCRRHEKKPVTVNTIEGDSAILPRAATPFREDGGASATRTSTHTIEAAGRSRRYVLVEPAALEKARRYPLVFVFHGDGGDAASFHGAFPFEKASGADALLAYPDGIGTTWDLETTTDNREVKLVEAIIEELARRFPVDRARIYATGYSSGGFLSNVIACQRSGLLRAITSSAGGAPYKQDETWPNGFPKCPGQAPIAMLALHGESDHGVTLDSGRFSAEYWAYINGCQTEQMETTGYDECRVYRGCPAGKGVGLCVVPRLGHWVWAQAAEASWTFFRTQTL
jgi:polyhydroxybutyrate depolymerase